MKIPCMKGGDCQARFFHADINKIGDQELTDQFHRKYREFTVQISKDAWWCNTPDCDTIVKTEGALDDLATCSTCRMQLCVKCGEKPHPDVPCSPAIDFAALGMKKCPTCITPIQRIDGCNEMHCTRCFNYFCYNCGQDITNNLDRHF